MSIFSVGDNSNYNSILSQNKALKENKEKSKINFANALIKDNVTKLNQIQTQNSQVLAKNEALNFNPLTNTLKNSIYTLKYKQADAGNAVSIAYGYGVDSDGYMSSDFNKAAGLPENFKIHKSTLDEIKRYNEDNWVIADLKQYLGVDNYFSNIDMADTIKQYYNVFSQALSQTFPSDKTSFSQKDINSMPSGYAFSGDVFANNGAKIQYAADYSELAISNVYQTPQQLKEANELYVNVGNAINGIAGSSYGLSLQDLEKTYGDEGKFNLDMSFYPKNENGEYSKEALFMSFLKANDGKVLYSPNNKLNPIVEAYNTQMAKQSSYGENSVNLKDIMIGKIDFASLLKAQAQESWLDSNIYAYENGISWQNSSIGYGGAWFDKQFEEAKKNGWKASSSSIDSYVSSITQRLQNLINQTRVA